MYLLLIRDRRSLDSVIDGSLEDGLSILEIGKVEASK